MENDQVNRENAIKKNRQIVIRAIEELLEFQKNACLEVKKKSTNTSSEEIKQIIQHIDHGLDQLYQFYGRCKYTVETSIDEALFEQVNSEFSSHAFANQARLVNFAQEIDQWDALLCQQNLERILNEQSELLNKNIQKLLKVCCLSIWTTKLNALKSELECFIAQTVSTIKMTTKENHQFNIQCVAASSKEFGMKIQELDRAIEQKGNLLKSIQSCLSEAETKYQQTRGTLSNMSDEDFWDIQRLMKEVDSVKAEVDNGFLCE